MYRKGCTVHLSETQVPSLKKILYAMCFIKGSEIPVKYILYNLYTMIMNWDTKDMH